MFLWRWHHLLNISEESIHHINIKSETIGTRKCGVDDLYWFIILFFIHIDAFRVEKLEESTHKTIFTDGIQFDKVGFETFGEHFEESTTFSCGVKLFFCKLGRDHSFSITSN